MTDLTPTFSRQNITREVAPHLWERVTMDVWKFLGDERAAGVWQEGRVIVQAFVRRGGAWLPNGPHILHVSASSTYILDPPSERELRAGKKRVAVSIDKNGKAAFTRLKDTRGTDSDSEGSEMTSETEAAMALKIDALTQQNEEMRRQMNDLVEAVRGLTVQFEAAKAANLKRTRGG